jgi:hypothetical protein
MKTQNSVVVWLKLSVVAMAIVSLVGVTGVQAATLPNSITIRNQDLSSGVIVVDSVNAPVDGWIVIYKNPNLTPGEIVGYAPVHQGSNMNVKVSINTARVGDSPMLWARLHADNGVPGLFEWGLKGLPYNDTPIMQNGQYILTGFGTAADEGRAASTVPATPAAPAPSAAVAPKVPVSAKPVASANPIVVKNQDLSTGVIVVDSVTAPVDGWIVVYKSPNFTPGQIVGYAPVYQGVNTGVKVTIDTAKVGQLPTLWAILHSDGGVPGVFEWGFRNQPYDDAPIIANGWYVEAAFGTAGQ